MRLYALSDSILTPYNKLPKMLSIALESGVSIFQLRDKEQKDSTLLPLALDLADICKQYNALFIINDRARLALDLQDRGISCGLHLGRDDEENLSYKEVRDKFSGIIGISCYGDINRALAYQALGADYVAFGSIFQSYTKPSSKVVGYEILKTAKECLKIDICAIGGINANNISHLKHCDMIALIGSIWRGDIKENIEELLQRFYA